MMEQERKWVPVAVVFGGLLLLAVVLHWLDFNNLRCYKYVDNDPAWYQDDKPGC